jgi:hypothetical protein
MPALVLERLVFGARLDENRDPAVAGFAVLPELMNC